MKPFGPKLQLSFVTSTPRLRINLALSPRLLRHLEVNLARPLLAVYRHVRRRLTDALLLQGSQL